MPGAKHSSLNALSPSNYGSVRRKRSQRLPDPSDPPLNVETGMGSPAPPPSRVRRLMGKIAAHPPPHPPSLPWGPEVLCSTAGFLPCGGRELTCVPSKAGSPLLSEPNRKNVDFLLIQQADRECGPPRTSWEVLCHQGLHVPSLYAGQNGPQAPFIFLKIC